MATPSCPRCDGLLEQSDVGDGVLRCGGCGSFVCTPGARARLTRFLKVSDEIWSALRDGGGRGPRCALCGDGMRTFNMKGVTVDGCACGALLLDPGELRRLTGRDEGEAPQPSSSSWSTPSPAPASLGRVHLAPAQALSQFLAPAPWVQLRQERPTLVGAAFSLDFGTRFAVATPAGSGILQRQEGGVQLLARMFLGGLVKQRFTLRDTRDTPMLVLDRSFEKLVLSRLDVAYDDAGDPGERLGSVERSFAVTETRYELKDNAGRLFARLVRPMTSLWQFRLETADGAASGAVAKQWSGFASEFFTDADDYGVDFGTRMWTVEQRAVIVAAALSVDLDHFERNQPSKGRSLLGLLD